MFECIHCSRLNDGSQQISPKLVNFTHGLKSATSRFDVKYGEFVRVASSVSREVLCAQHYRGNWRRRVVASAFPVYLWGSPFSGEIVLGKRPGFNPTIEVVTFRLRGW